MPRLFGALLSRFFLLLLLPTHNLQDIQTLCSWPHTQLQSWPAASKTETERAGTGPTPPRAGQPGPAPPAGAPTPPPDCLLLSWLLSLVWSAAAFSFSFRSPARACPRLLARVIACQGCAQGTEGWDSHSLATLPRMGNPEGQKGLG